MGYNGLRNEIELAVINAKVHDESYGKDVLNFENTEASGSKGWFEKIRGLINN